MDINDIKHLAVERIFLVPDASEGRLGYAWCDDPAPGVIMEKPATSLARRDLIKQAEILELAESAMVNDRDAATLRLNAEQLRHQAEARQ